MELEFLKPLTDSVAACALASPKGAIGHGLKLHTKAGLPDLKGVQLALIGILENRLDAGALLQVRDFEEVRLKLYNLYPGNWATTVADLGDVEAGATVEDTYFLVNKITAYCLINNIVPMFLGGSQDLMYPAYRAFDEHYQMINVVNIDSRFDLGDIEAPINSRSYIGKMVVEKPYNLFNYSNLGYQTYFNSQDEIELLERMYFEAVRLGVLDEDIALAEPLLRDADLVGIDMTAVKSGDIAFAKANPNGLSGRQICTLSRYAGISDRTKVLGIYEIPLAAGHTATQLVAEVLWYFIEGFNLRSNEYPVAVNDSFIKYRVPVQHEVLTFYKSTKTGRFWIELPFVSVVQNKLKQHALLPCSKLEYELACDQVLPDRWLKARQKNEA